MAGFFRQLIFIATILAAELAAELTTTRVRNIIHDAVGPSFPCLAGCVKTQHDHFRADQRIRSMGHRWHGWWWGGKCLGHRKRGWIEGDDERRKWWRKDE
jgi:hypothetical protein